MNHIPLWVQFTALIVLLLLSAFFSIAETSMMALNRYRLKALAKQGKRGAILAEQMLGQTERLLGMILIGNNLINAAASSLVTAIAISHFGNDDSVLFIATSLIAFLIIVFAEITPKVIGATFPEQIALPLAFVLKPLAWLLTPAVWFVNLFTGFLLRPFRIQATSETSQQLSPEELRMIVLESSHYIPKKHHSILMNLFDLEAIAVHDVMVPRTQLEALDLTDSLEAITERLTTCYHNKLPVYEGEINRIVGILHVRKCLALLAENRMSKDHIRGLLNDAYFIPGSTQVLQQLQYFQENHQRVGIVVDEYGEVIGLVTLEDITEEMIGKFTTSIPRSDSNTTLTWNAHNQVTVDGTSALRELNRCLKTNFSLDGPTTLNGLVLEELQQIPDANVCLRVGECAIEILQVQHQSIKVAKLTRLFHC